MKLNKLIVLVLGLVVITLTVLSFVNDRYIFVRSNVLTSDAIDTYAYVMVKLPIHTTEHLAQVENTDKLTKSSVFYPDGNTSVFESVLILKGEK